MYRGNTDHVTGTMYSAKYEHSYTDIAALADYQAFSTVKSDQVNIAASQEQSIPFPSIAFRGGLCRRRVCWLFKGIRKSLHCMKTPRTPLALPLSHTDNRGTTCLVIAAQLNNSRGNQKYLEPSTEEGMNWSSCCHGQEPGPHTHRQGRWGQWGVTEQLLLGTSLEWGHRVAGFTSAVTLQCLSVWDVILVVLDHVICPAPREEKQSQR